MTLDQALVRASATRPQVMAAAAVVGRARGTSRTGTTIPNPTMQFEHHELAPSYRVSVTQSLAWLPRHRADRAAGRATVERATADSTQMLADLAWDVRGAFFKALAARELAQLLGEEAMLADSLLVLAERRVAAGDISALERDQIAQEASRARLALARAREASEVTQVGFARAVAWQQEDTALRPAGRLDDGLADARATAREGLSSNLVRDDGAEVPVLRAAVADSSAAAARLRAAKLAQVPVPSVLAGLQWSDHASARNNTVIGFAIALPLWQHGGGNVAEARGAAAETAARIGEARLALAAQLEDIRIRVTEAAARAAYAADSLLPEARRIRAGAIRLYEAGRTSVLPVFDALRVERDVAQTVVQELLTFQQARADLLVRLGRWQ